MTNVDIIVAAIFCLVVFATGVSFLKTGSNARSFFAGGGHVPWWVSGISLFMSFFSVGTFVVWGAVAYSDGFVSVAMQATMCLSGVLIGLFIAARWNRTNVLTAAEFIGERLGTGPQKTYTALFLVVSIFTAGNFLYPVGKIIEVSTGIPLDTSLIVLGVLILVYTAVGGLWAVLVTDVLQFVVLGAAVIIVVPLAFAEVGGVSAFIEKAPDNFFALHNDTYSWAFLVAFLIYNTVYIGGNWAYVQRYTSVATPRDARRVAWLFAALYTISPLIWMLPPMIYRVMQPDLTDLANEGAYLLVSKAVVPAGLLGLILGSMVFATASSVNTTLNITAGVFVNDLYRHVRRDISDRETMMVARGATILFGLFSIAVALMIQYLGGIVEVVLSVAAITGGALFMPPMWALYSRRQTGTSTLTTTLVCLAVNIFFKFISPGLLDISLSRTGEMVLGIGGPITLLLFFELWYRARNREDQQFAAYEQGRLQRADAKATAAAQAGAANRRGQTIICLGVVAVGAMITLLGLLSEDILVSILVSVIGVVICVAAVTGLRTIRLSSDPLLFR